MSFSLRSRTSCLACTTLVSALLATGCATGQGTASSAQPTATSSPSQPLTASPAKTQQRKPQVRENAADACYARKNAFGDIFVQMITPGQAPIAQELGGEWTWNSATDKCLTSVQMIISTAPRLPGNCTQVAYAADNPGYNPDRTPAAPLKKVIASAGPAC
jgi:hypothetical protein